MKTREPDTFPADVARKLKTYVYRLIDPRSEILRNKPEQGYLTISNALQWRLQYGRVVKLSESVNGIVRIINKI